MSRPRVTRSLLASAPRAAILAAGLTLTLASATFGQPVDYLKIAPLPGNNVVGEDVGCVRPTAGALGDNSREQFVAIGFNNGSNGIPEDGGGDDIDLGPVTAGWSWELVEIHPDYGSPPLSDIGDIDPMTGLFTAATVGISARGLVTAVFPGAIEATVPIYIFCPDFVQDPPRATFHLDCVADGNDVTVTWINGELYDGVLVLRDGQLVGTLAGDATSFVDMGVPAGAHTYSVMGQIGGTESPERQCPVGVGTDEPLQLIWIPRGGNPGGAATAAALSGALDDLAVPHVVVEELIGLDFSRFSVIWASVGLLFPDQHVIKPWEGDRLADFLLAGGRVYMEGGEVWSQPTPTRFHDLAGIESISVFTGSVNSVTGEGMGNCDFTGLGGDYTGDDFQIDEIAPTQPEGFSIWRRNTSNDVIGVYSETVGTPGRVIGTTWFLGGLDGSVTPLVERYLECLDPIVGPPEFRRGDADGNGQLALGDALLGLNHLFLGFSVECQDAVDFDDSGGLALGDALGLLNFLFLFGPPPAPPIDCGVDPTPDTLDCPSFSGCP